MSRLFYHTCQDNAGNLLFDVSGTMRLAGTGTLATIYGDEALTVILPNPMTNHPSFGSFKCFLPSGDFDFYLAKSGYTFETLTGVQGHGTMAQQDASAVAITGGQIASLGSLGVAGPSQLIGAVGIGGSETVGYALNLVGKVIIPNVNLAAPHVLLQYDKTAGNGITFRQFNTDTGGGGHCGFQNMAGTIVGEIISTATATAYNTTSDARLKHAIAPLTGELEVVQALRPVAFRWNSDGSRGYGFIASEVQQVLPDANIITGTPAATNEDGTINPQMIDHSKLVPWLVGALKTLAARVAVLEDALGV